MTTRRHILVAVAATAALTCWSGACKEDQEQPAADSPEATAPHDHAHDGTTAHTHDHEGGHQHSAPEASAAHDHAHSHALLDPPDTLQQAINRIGLELDKIGASMAAGRATDAHQPCDVIVELCTALPKLAMATGSGVPRDAIKTINQAQKDLAAHARAAHVASESGNAADLAPLHKDMVAVYQTLRPYAPESGKEQDAGHDHEHGPGSEHGPGHEHDHGAE